MSLHGLPVLYIHLVQSYTPSCTHIITKMEFFFNMLPFHFAVGHFILVDQELSLMVR